jgi:hypothetical protein
MSRVTGLLRRSFVVMLLVIIGLAFFSGPVAAAEQGGGAAPAHLAPTASEPNYAPQPVACVLFATQQAGTLTFSMDAARVLREPGPASADICDLNDSGLLTSGHGPGLEETSSVTLLDISAAPSLTQRWWWVAWPWLMLLLALLSLIGYVLIRRHQLANDELGQ